MQTQCYLYSNSAQQQSSETHKQLCDVGQLQQEEERSIYVLLSKQPQWEESGREAI